MKIETSPLEDHQVKLTVEVEPDLMEDAKQRAGRKLAKQVKIPGFRPGKAPYAMVVRHVGEPAILEEATEILVNDIYPKVIDESGVNPYGPGSLENIVSMDPPTFEFVIPLKATVELPDYKSIRVPYGLKETTGEDVERVIANLRDRQAVQEPVERSAQEGDMVYLHLSGQRLGAEEGKDPTLVKDREMQVVIQTETANNPEEWPFPGFSRELIGLSAGEEKDLSHTFSEESVYESLRGVNAEFHAKVDEVKSRTLPEVNDEFAQTVGDYASLEDLRSKIKEDLQEHERDSYNQDYDQRVIDAVAEGAAIKYPPQMLDREIESVIDSLKDRLAQQNLDLDLYLKTRQMDMQALREETRPVAEERLKKTLVLMELSDAEAIKVNADEVQSETTRTLEAMARMLPEKDVRRLSGRDAVSNLVGNIMMDMVTHRTLDRMRDIARGLAEIGVESEPDTLQVGGVAEASVDAPQEPDTETKDSSEIEEKTASDVSSPREPNEAESGN